MVFNSRWVATVATLSADLCQYISCNPERLPSDEVLRLLCCLPLHHLGRLALRLFSFFCFPVAFPAPGTARFRHRYTWSSSSLSSSSSSPSDDSDGDESHSD